MALEAEQQRVPAPHRITAARQARRLALTHSTAVFSTLSYKMNGHPFGSVSPIGLTDTGDVLFYVSDIAQHARNLNHDPRLSVTVFEPSTRGDQNEQARLTLSGNAKPLEGEEGKQALARYLRLFPDAQGYTKAHDFKIWGMRVEHIRYIGGFGEIFWLTADEWLLPAPLWSAEDEAGMVKHMNEDHADACALLLQQYKKAFEPTDSIPNHAGQGAKMVAIYPDGCYVMQARQRYFVPFEGVCSTPMDVRKMLASMTRKARNEAV